MKRFLGVSSGIAGFLVTLGISLEMLLAGKGTSSPMCERNCDYPVYAPDWVDTLLRTGFFIFIALAGFLFFAEKYRWSAYNETDEVGFGAAVGAGSGCLLGFVILISGIVYSIVEFFFMRN